MNKLCWNALGLVGLMAASLATDAEADVSSGTVRAGSKVGLACSYRASDVERVYDIKNDHPKPIKAGTRIHAESNSNGTYRADKRPAALVLATDLAPGRTTQISVGGSTNAGKCVAYFVAEPVDLTIDSVAWTKVPVGAGKFGDGAKAVVRNLNDWVESGVSRTRVSSMGCKGQTVEAKEVDTPSIAPGATKIVVVRLLKFPPAVYLRAEANATGSLDESSKDNNVLEDGKEDCNK